MNETKLKIISLFNRGFKASFIAKKLDKSKSTVYKYIQENYAINRYPGLKNEIKLSLLQGDVKIFIRNLLYKDICLLRRKFNLSGTDKSSKINAIIDYLLKYSVLGLYPEIDFETIVINQKISVIA